MTKKTTRRALVVSILSLVLCFTMLVGTTFAWFTDSVKSGKNKIVAGNLDVELEYAKFNNGKFDKWVSVEGAEDIFDPNALWEPGHTEVAYLKVSNLGTLALKYQLNVNVYGEVAGINVDDEVFYLSDYLVFKVVEIDEKTVGTYTRDTAMAAAGTTRGLKAYNGETKNLEKTGDADYVALIIYMPTTVDNKANYKTGTTAPSIEMGVELYATQMVSEDDSFGNNYDENAWDDAMKVHSAADLKAALANGGKIILLKDIEAIETLTIPAGVEVVLDLNGKTLTGTKGRDADNNRVHVLVNNGNLTINGGTVKSAGNDGGSAICNNAGASLTINDVALYGAPLSDPVYEAGVSKPYPSYAFNNYGTAVINGATIKSYHGAVATGDNGTTIINDADIDVGLGKSTGITSYLIYSYGNAQVTVNGGKFAFTKKEVYVNGGNTFCELGTNPIIVNGGNYIGTSFSVGAGREYVICGGTFDKDPSAYVADGFKAVKNGELYYVVADGVDNVIVTAEDLVAAFANLKAGDVLYVAADLDMTGKTITPVTGNKGFTMYGNGYTISNLNTTAAALFVDHSGSSSYTFDSVVLENCSVNSSTNYGALFVGDGDTSDAITITNCVVKNCSVKSAKYAAAFVGYTAGYNVVNNGPVYSDVLVEDCSVIGGSITGDGSVGAAIGHAGGNVDTTTTVTNLTVDGVAINGEDAEHTGVIVGTAHVGKTIINNCTYKNITGNYNGLYGRFVPGTTGKLVIDGASVLAAATDDALKNAINSGETEILVPAGTYEFPASSIKAGSTIICDEGTVFAGNSKLNIKGATVVGATFANPTGTAADQTINGIFKDCVFDGSNGLRWCYAGETVVFENCVFTGDLYGVHFDGGANDVTFKGCTFSGFNALGGAITQVTMEDCTFVSNGRSGYNGINLWGGTDMKNCKFVFDGSTTEWVDVCGDNKICNFEGCIVSDGTTERALTAADVGDYGSGNTITVK